MVELNNFTSTPVRERFIRMAAELVTRGEGRVKEELSVAFIGQKRMRQLNKIYRGKNQSTDVLAFPAEGVHQKQFYGKKRSTGEVIISLPDIKKNSKRFNVLFEEELIRIVVHGILHLLGYDHEKTKREAKRMFDKQEYYLTLIKELQ